ncbi:unnamed protein product [Mesocestoides corti]|uniref:Mesoderm induction early response protein 1 n=2 Tax=Mesocestoides corti TaxID=53468 RepID=A0A0R3U3H8_MESCO|nr:unnamed protein product [Mesocestoides corti]
MVEMPEPNSVDGGKTEIELINLDDDTDTGDSEFELPEGSGAQDDDSIAADEDVADEEEVNGLMRESEMSLSELLASYGLPASAIPDGPVGASVVGSVQSGNERPTLRKRRHTALGNTSSEAQVDGNRAGHQTTDAVTADKVIRSEAEVGGANTSAIEIDLTSSNGNADEEEDEEAEDDDRADDADNDEDEVGSDEADGGEDDDMKSHAVSLWCQALAAGDSPPAYNSEEDEDYLPNVEGEGDWRGEMHVGDDYQATVPPSTQPINSRQDSHLGQEALMLWQPGHLPEVDVERYQQTYSRTLSLAAPISRIPDDEEALFLLLRSNFDTDEALQRLQMKPVQPTEIPPHLETWSELDCAAFEKGFIAFNKNFLQIQENKLRHKTVAELVHFYYLWKKTARHDEFIRLYRREKKKPLHPGIT